MNRDTVLLVSANSQFAMCILIFSFENKNPDSIQISNDNNNDLISNDNNAINDISTSNGDFSENINSLILRDLCDAVSCIDIQFTSPVYNILKTFIFEHFKLKTPVYHSLHELISN